MNTPEDTVDDALNLLRLRESDEALLDEEIRKDVWHQVESTVESPPRSGLTRLKVASIALGLGVLGVFGAGILRGERPRPTGDMPTVRADNTATVAPKPSTGARTDETTAPTEAPNVVDPASLIGPGGEAPSVPSSRTTLAATRRGSQRSPDDLSAERKLIDEARARFRAGDFAKALDAIRLHLVSFPDGQLAEERQGLRVRVLVAAGRCPEATTAARQFRRAYPKSLLLPVVEQTIRSCN